MSDSEYAFDVWKKFQNFFYKKTQTLFDYKNVKWCFHELKHEASVVRYTTEGPGGIQKPVS